LAGVCDVFMWLMHNDWNAGAALGNRFALFEAVQYCTRFENRKPGFWRV